MGFKDKKRKQDEKKTPEKKVVHVPAKKVVIKKQDEVLQNRVVKKEPVKVKEEKVIVIHHPLEKKDFPVTVKEEKKEEIKEPEQTVNLKSEYYGLGITGYHKELTQFKATCKLKSFKVGNELVKMLTRWNEENK